MWKRALCWVFGCRWTPAKLLERGRFWQECTRCGADRVVCIGYIPDPQGRAPEDIPPGEVTYKMWEDE